MIGQQFGNYVATRLLGSGGMGQVYAAEHPEIGREVAVKVLTGNLHDQLLSARRFVNEALAIARIRHPSIVEVYDFGRTYTGQLYYTMELLKGRELAAVMAQHGPMTPQEVLPYLEPICSALQAAHDAGIIHRDLKPQNIFVLEGAPLRVKILDFGVAKLLCGDAANLDLSLTGQVLGTPVSIAPEQAEGEPVGPQSDLYSVGVVLYWMLAGRPPFAADSTTMYFLKHIGEEPVPLGQVRPELAGAVSQVVDRCLEKDPNWRHGSATELLLDFADAAQVTVGAAQPLSPEVAPLEVIVTVSEALPTPPSLTDELAALLGEGCAAPDTLPSGRRAADPVVPLEAVLAVPAELEQEVLTKDVVPKTRYRWLALALACALLLLIGGWLGLHSLDREPSPTGKPANQVSGDSNRKSATTIATPSL